MPALEPELHISTSFTAGSFVLGGSGGPGASLETQQGQTCRNVSPAGTVHDPTAPSPSLGIQPVQTHTVPCFQSTQPGNDTVDCSSQENSEVLQLGTCAVKGHRASAAVPALLLRDPLPALLLLLTCCCPECSSTQGSSRCSAAQQLALHSCAPCQAAAQSHSSPLCGLAQGTCSPSSSLAGWCPWLRPVQPGKP